MSTVLTIDFDIIMAPSIDYYNHLVPLRKWNEMPGNNFYADLSHYQKLFLFIQELANKNNLDDFYFIESHDQVINLIKDMDNIDLINIDHHHDICYLNKKDNLNCGNWVYFLQKQGILNSYFWINNENSLKPAGLIDSKIISKEECFRTFELSNIVYADKIIICLSPEWIPPQYHPLYTLIYTSLN